MSARDRKRLFKALLEAKAYRYQSTMAACLLAVNGIDNALEFVEGLVKRGLTAKPMQLSLFDGEEPIRKK